MKSLAKLFLTIGACILIISACAASDGNDLLKGGLDSNGANPASRITACRSTDRLVESSQQCLLDDAACYQISSGQWCTGERGSVCPAGSTALTAGASCAAGARCFRVSESLECQIGT